MKQSAIIVWPRSYTKQTEIEKIITADGYIVTESHKGNPATKWNFLKKELIVLIVETNRPLRISDILGELAKHCCEAVRGTESQEEITEMLFAFRAKNKEVDIKLGKKTKKK